jgi:hypothetical protein
VFFVARVILRPTPMRSMAMPRRADIQVSRPVNGSVAPVSWGKLVVVSTKPVVISALA